MTTKTITCPGDLEWSAFGADYPDTVCSSAVTWESERDNPGDGVLCDADDEFRPKDIPCPFCLPIAFLEYQSGGRGVEPTCRECLTRLTPEAVTFHDGQALTWTVACPTCGEPKPGLMREYD